MHKHWEQSLWFIIPTGTRTFPITDHDTRNTSHSIFQGFYLATGRWCRLPTSAAGTLKAQVRQACEQLIWGWTFKKWVQGADMRLSENPRRDLQVWKTPHRTWLRLAGGTEPAVRGDTKKRERPGEKKEWRKNLILPHLCSPCQFRRTENEWKEVFWAPAGWLHSPPLTEVPVLSPRGSHDGQREKKTNGSFGVG